MGRAIALAMARAGADLAINYPRPADQAAEVKRTASEAGRRAILVQADVSNTREADAMVSSAEQHLNVNGGWYMSS